MNLDAEDEWKGAGRRRQGFAEKLPPLHEFRFSLDLDSVTVLWNFCGGIFRRGEGFGRRRRETLKCDYGGGGLRRVYLPLLRYLWNAKGPAHEYSTMASANYGTKPPSEETLKRIYSHFYD
jgi:hypothetical protein